MGGVAEELGLVAVGRHARLEDDRDEAARARRRGPRARLAARSPSAGCDPSELDDSTLARLAAAASAVAAHGLELGYHNHDAEVEQGFLERLPAGGLPRARRRLGLVRRRRSGRRCSGAGRSCTSRISAFAASIRTARSATARSGYERIVPAAERAGVEWLIVEQDEPVGAELDDARRSLAAVITMLGEVA